MELKRTHNSTGVRAQDTVQADVQSQTDKRRAIVDGLNPGTGYRFRVIGLNMYGAGTPSTPSCEYISSC